MSLLLDALRPDDARALLAAARPRELRTGDAVLRGNDVNTSLWIVESGRVEVRLGRGEASRTVGTVGPGGFFGEVSLFEPGLTTASVTAREATRLLEFPREVLDRFGEERPAAAATFYASILQELSKRIRRMDRELAESIYWLFD